MVRERSHGLTARSTTEILIMESKEASASGKDSRVIRISVSGTTAASRAMAFTNGLMAMSMRGIGQTISSLEKVPRLSQTETHTQVTTKTANNMALATTNGRTEHRILDTLLMVTRMVLESGVKMDEQKQANMRVISLTIRSMVREFSPGKVATATKVITGWTCDKGTGAWSGRMALTTRASGIRVCRMEQVA